MQHSKIILALNILGLLAGFVMAAVSVILYNAGASDIQYAALKALLVGLLISAFCILGGAISWRAYVRDRAWAGGNLLVVSSFSILVILLMGKIVTVDQPQTRLLFEFGFYLMLSETIIWSQLLLLARLRRS